MAMSAIGSFLSGFVQGGAETAIRQLEQQRAQEFNAARILLSAGIETGELGSLYKVMDPKFTRALGLTPEVVAQADQLLAPIRAERQQRIAFSQAQARRAGAEATGMEATEQLIGQLPPDMQLAARVPGIGQQITQRMGAEAQKEQAAAGTLRATTEAQQAPAETKAKLMQAGAAQTSAGASAMQAQKELTFDQRMKLIQEKSKLDLEEVKARAGVTGRDEMDRAIQQSYTEAGKGLQQAKQAIYKVAAPHPKSGEILFDTEQQAAEVLANYNDAVQRYNQIAIQYGQRYNIEPTLAPMAGIEPVAGLPQKILGETLASPKGFRLKFGVMAPKGSVTETIQQGTGAIDLGSEEEIMKKYKKAK